MSHLSLLFNVHTVVTTLTQTLTKNSITRARKYVCPDLYITCNPFDLKSCQDCLFTNKCLETKSDLITKVSFLISYNYSVVNCIVVWLRVYRAFRQCGPTLPQGTMSYDLSYSINETLHVCCQALKCFYFVVLAMIQRHYVPGT